MSLGKLSPTNSFLVLFLVGAVIGFGTFAGILTTSDPASIGDITSPTEFGVGSWFRYDAQWLGEKSKQIYLVTEIVNVTSTNATDGDPFIASYLGDVKWYNWSVKAYWMDGAEAVELYGKNDTGIVLWDNFGYFFLEGYKNRFSYSIDDVLTKKSDISTWGAIFRPQSIIYGSYNGIPQYVDGFLFNTTDWITGIWAHRALSAGNPLFAYQKQPVDSSKLISLEFDKETGLLLFVSTSGLDMWEWGLTGYSIKSPLAMDIPGFEMPEYTIGKGTGSADFILKFSDFTYEKIEVIVHSNDSSILESFNITSRTDTIPFDLLDVGTVELNVSARATRFGNVISSWLNNTFIVSKSADVGIQLATPVITNATINQNTITVTWDEVANASSYRIFVNGSFIDNAYGNAFIYHPNENGTFGFSIIADSNIYNVSSNMSSVEHVNFTVVGSLFNLADAMPPGGIPGIDVIGIVLMVVIISASAILGVMLILKYGKKPRKTDGCSRSNRKITGDGRW